jgi:hypothetical protein
VANAFTKQITEQGPRNLVVKFTGLLDSSDVNLSPALLLADSNIGDTAAGPIVGYGIDTLRWSVSQPLTLQLAWDGIAPETIANMHGWSKICASGYGGWNPNQLANGYTGNLILRSYGFVPGTTVGYTLIVEATKLYARRT